MSTNDYGLELPSSWLRKRKRRSGDITRLYQTSRFGGGNTAEEVIWLDWLWTPPAGGGGAAESDTFTTGTDQLLTDYAPTEWAFVQGTLSVAAATDDVGVGPRFPGSCRCEPRGRSGSKAGRKKLGQVMASSSDRVVPF